MTPTSAYVPNLAKEKAVMALNPADLRLRITQTLLTSGRLFL